MKMTLLVTRLISAFQKEVRPFRIYLVSGIFSLLLFGMLFGKYRIIKPDLQSHIQTSIEMMHGKVIGHPIFFFLIQLFSGFSEDENVLIYASVVVFALAQIFKIIFSLRFVNEVFNIKTSVFLFVLVLAAQVVIGNSFLQEHYVMGSLSPNYFHNGTLLLSMPFVMLFLLENHRFFVDNQRKHIFRMLAYGVIIVFIKPSFLFCWIPVMPFLWLLKFGPKRSLLGILQVAVVLVGIIIFQSQLLKSGAANFKVVFHPFGFFGSYFNHVRVVVASLFFPLIVFLLCTRKFLQSNVLIVFAFFVLQGLILSFSFYDTINGLVSPNMTWQSSIMSYLMILGCIGMIIKEYQQIGFPRFMLVCIALMVHLACGIRYLQMAIANKSFFI